MKNKILEVVVMIVLFIGTTFPQFQISNSIISSGGNTISSTSYNFSSTVGESFIGKSVSAANQQQVGFWYVYQQITITGVDDEEMLPTVFKLEQNYPNPFNPSTTIKFAVPERSNVLIKIYDILGSEVSTLVNEEKPAGTYELTWEAIGLSSGIYFYQLKAGEYVNTKKMLLIK
jgi:hypothetical protein